MKNNRRSDPSLSAKGSKVATVSHGMGITMKLKKSDFVSGSDGEGLEGALHGSPAEGSWKKIFPIYLGNRLRVTKRSSQHESPSSSDASSPLSRKKKRSKRIHITPVVRQLSRSLSPPRRAKSIALVTKCSSQHVSPSSSEASSLSRKKKRSKRIHLTPVVRQLSRSLSPPRRAKSIALVTKCSSQHVSPSGSEASSSLSMKKKRSKRIHRAPVVRQLSRSLSPHSRAKGIALVQVLPNRSSLPESSYTDVEAQSTSEASDSLSRKKKFRKPPRMDKLIPPPSLGSSGEESTWRRTFQVLTDEKQRQEIDEIENIHAEIVSLSCKFNTADYFPKCDERQQLEVYQRLSQYYIEAHELPSPKKEPDNSQLNKELEPSLYAYERIFLRHVGDPEWYFHPEQCKLAGLEDYQRLVLRDDPMYGNWNEYRLYYHTYLGDVEYVQFCEQMAEKIKWIDDEEALFGDQRRRNELEAFVQAFRIAIQFRNLSGHAVNSSVRDHLSSLRFDINLRKDMDGVYLEIWKRVAKDKVNFGDALRELYANNIFPFRMPEIKSALDSYPGYSWIKSNYDTYVDGIDERLSEEEAHPLIIEAVNKMAEKRKNYLDYARKKLEIVARIGLKMSNLEVTAQGGEDHGEGRLQ